VLCRGIAYPPPSTAARAGCRSQHAAVQLQGPRTLLSKVIICTVRGAKNGINNYESHHKCCALVPWPRERRLLDARLRPPQFLRTIGPAGCGARGGPGGRAERCQAACLADSRYVGRHKDAFAGERTRWAPRQVLYRRRSLTSAPSRAVRVQFVILECHRSHSASSGRQCPCHTAGQLGRRPRALGLAAAKRLLRPLTVMPDA
jgi:hypothetical protein